MATQFHEDLTRATNDATGSDRSFGILFAVVFSIIALLPLIDDGEIRLWAFAPAAVFLVLAIASPRVLAPANRAWMRLGRLMNRIVSPLVLALLFLVAVVPTAVVLRVLGRDPLRLKFDQAAATYWLPRPKDGARTSFTDQF